MAGGGPRHAPSREADAQGPRGFVDPPEVSWPSLAPRWPLPAPRWPLRAPRWPPIRDPLPTHPAHAPPHPHAPRHAPRHAPHTRAATIRKRFAHAPRAPS
eukprot:3553370-Prymnesium_polylepis.1